MTILKAVILGLIQGISEFLPISSSGHLALAGKLMGMNPEAESMLSFNIMLHAATLLAVFLVFYKDIFGMIGGFFGGIARETSKRFCAPSGETAADGPKEGVGHFHERPAGKQRIDLNGKTEDDSEEVFGRRNEGPTGELRGAKEKTEKWEENKHAGEVGFPLVEPDFGVREEI